MTLMLPVDGIEFGTWSVSYHVVHNNTDLILNMMKNSFKKSYGEIGNIQACQTFNAQQTAGTEERK